MVGRVDGPWLLLVSGRRLLLLRPSVRPSERLRLWGLLFLRTAVRTATGIERLLGPAERATSDDPGFVRLREPLLVRLIDSAGASRLKTIAGASGAYPFPPPGFPRGKTINRY